MYKISEVPIVIPSLEPDDRLLDFLSKLKQAGFEDIVLVNDGSASKFDKYFVEAEQKYGCKVLQHAVNLGKGRALKTAFNYILNRNKESNIKLLGCVTADSDGQHTPEAVQKSIAALYKEPNNLVLVISSVCHFYFYSELSSASSSFDWFAGCWEDYTNANA